MANEGALDLPTSPPHSVEIGFSTWRHRAFVRLDGTPIVTGRTWKAPGADWTVPLPGVAGGPLRVEVRCAFEHLHYPHAHLMIARWRDERLVITSGIDLETLLKAARPAITL